jgi:Protein of unknown function (DUF2806)
MEEIMIDTTNQHSSSETPESGQGGLTMVTDAFTDLVTGASIPAPIRRNALKAFSQLCTALVDVPIAHLEGVAAEKRAETATRIKLISAIGDQISEQVNVPPEFSQSAVRKYGQKIIREQANLDSISLHAAKQIQQNAIQPKNQLNEGAEIADINDDWLNQFEKEASQKSTPEMQLLFSRILAGEIQNPESFSIKTVKLLAEMDHHVAILFRRLCSLCISVGPMDARVVSFDQNASQNVLKSYGLGFDQLNILQEYGLIIPDYNSYFDYRMSISDEAKNFVFLFNYQKQTWVFVPLNGRDPHQELRISGVALSRSGKELLRIVDPEPDLKYSADLQAFFRKQNLDMVQREASSH